MLVGTADGRLHSFQRSVQGPSDGLATVVPLNQSLDMASGELTSHVRFGAQDGSWAVELEVVQLISQSVPALGLQQIIVTHRTPHLNISLVPSLTHHHSPAPSP